MEKENKENLKQKRRQNQPSFLFKLLNKRVICTLSNSSTLEGILIGINLYEINLMIDNEEVVIFKHALTMIKEIKKDKDQLHIHQD